MTTAMAITELHREIRRRGWQHKATARILGQLLVHVVLTVAGIVLVMSAEGLGWRLLGLLIATYGTLGVGCNTHTSTHYATSDNRWVNEALSYFGYPVFLGLSLTFWWQKHVVIHHPAPNVIGVDGDVDLMPWFALTAAEVGGARGWRRFYYEHVQFWIFPVALVMNGFMMQKSGWEYLIGCLSDPRRRRRRTGSISAPCWRITASA
jgi:linoleoyl-CoA desaturase